MDDIAPAEPTARERRYFATRDADLKRAREMSDLRTAPVRARIKELTAALASSPPARRPRGRSLRYLMLIVIAAAVLSRAGTYIATDYGHTKTWHVYWGPVFVGYVRQGQYWFATAGYDQSPNRPPSVIPPR